jgi:hypothetical protein
MFMNKDKMYQKHLQSQLLSLPQPKNKCEINYSSIISALLSKIESKQK